MALFGAALATGLLGREAGLTRKQTGTTTGALVGAGVAGPLGAVGGAVVGNLFSRPSLGGESSPNPEIPCLLNGKAISVHKLYEFLHALRSDFCQYKRLRGEDAIPPDIFLPLDEQTIFCAVENLKKIKNEDLEKGNFLTSQFMTLFLYKLGKKKIDIRFLLMIEYIVGMMELYINQFPKEEIEAFVESIPVPYDDGSLFNQFEIKLAIILAEDIDKYLCGKKKVTYKNIIYSFTRNLFFNLNPILNSL